MPNVKPHTKSYIACPCGEGEWRAPTQVPLRSSYTWFCDGCGILFTIKPLENGTFDLTANDQRKQKILATLESGGPVRVVIEGIVFSHKDGAFDSQLEQYNKLQFFYDEHTCPTNWTANIVQMIDPADEEDKDPHGIFKLKSIEPWRDLEGE